MYFNYIPCFRFDDLQSSIDVENINFIKIDVEGAELPNPGRDEEQSSKTRPNILCEVLFTDKDGDISTTKSRNQKLMALLKQLDFNVIQLFKTYHSPQLKDVKRIEEFSSEYWTAENADECDYLFIPKEKENQVISSLFPGHATTVA